MYARKLPIPKRTVNSTTASLSFWNTSPEVNYSNTFPPPADSERKSPEPISSNCSRVLTTFTKRVLLTEILNPKIFSLATNSFSKSLISASPPF